MKICAVTGSRADWGLLRPVLSRLRDSGIDLQIIATGSHLDDAFGTTAASITDDGFHIDRTIPLARQSDDDHGIAAAMADALRGITHALNTLSPDMLLVLGDRYEIFAAAQAALISRIPIAHIAGGDVSEGAYDDAMRHAISKLAHLHFVTNEPARRRLLQMGESADRIWLSGSPGIDALLATPRWDRTRLATALGFGLRRHNLAITLHPATLDPTPPEQQLEPLLAALHERDDDTGLIFTGANADTGGSAFNQAIQDFVAAHDNACFRQSLGQTGYYSLVAQADLVVGNSSSGLYEAPTLGTPTLDIGMRQQGRLRGASVRHASNDATAIARAIDEMLANPPTDFSNPYGDGHASARIVDALRSIDDPRQLLIKRFEDRHCD